MIYNTLSLEIIARVESRVDGLVVILRYSCLCPPPVIQWVDDYAMAKYTYYFRYTVVF